MLRILVFCGGLLCSVGAVGADQSFDRWPTPVVPAQQTYQCRDYNSLVRCTRSCRAQLSQCYDRAGIDGSMQSQCESYNRQCVSGCFSNYCQ